MRYRALSTFRVYAGRRFPNWGIESRPRVGHLASTKLLGNNRYGALEDFGMELIFGEELLFMVLAQSIQESMVIRTMLLEFAKGRILNNV